MGWASEQMIVEHNARLESDDDYADDYNRAMDAALEAEWEAELIASELENEKFVNWFPDRLIDHTGAPVELKTEPTCFLVDDDLPF